MENQNPVAQGQNDQGLIINLADLDLIRQIIDLATSRGAFKGPELSDIGRVYNKLTAFLDLAVAQAQAEQEAANPAPQDNSSAPSAEAPSQGE
jgi:hypothetical protein